MNYWLMKSEPETWSWEQQVKAGAKGEGWDGVRNYQARNFMRDDMKLGDKVLFYHSNTSPPGIVGLAEVSKESYPDFFAWDKNSKYFDPKSPEDAPRWMMVDVQFIEKFPKTITLDDIKNNPKLSEMLVIKKGMRLSIQPVSVDQYSIIVNEMR